MSKITIPPAALEAGARAACRAVEKAHGDMQSWNYLGYENVEAFVDAAWPNYVEQTRAAFVAMVEAWEGAKRVKGYFTHDTDYYEPAFILPLEAPQGRISPQEGGDE